jgi:C_GCAxxG_C_C family probable redox protein
VGILTDDVAVEVSQAYMEGFYCSEAILRVYNQRLNLNLNENALKMATAFGAGLGGSKCCCGALTGAIMVLSAVKGRTDPGESEAEIFILTARFHDRFKKRFGSSCCKVLSKGYAWASAAHKACCADVTKGCAELLSETLNEILPTVDQR